MNNTITKADAVYMANEVYSNNWLELGDMTGEKCKPRKYRMTESQVRMISLVLLNRRLGCIHRLAEPLM